MNNKTEDNLSEVYKENIFNKLIGLKDEIDNLRQTYLNVDRRFSAMSTLADKTTADAVRETIDAEELARLSLVPANLAYKAALLLGNHTLVEATKECVACAENAHKVAMASTITNANRQTEAGR